ncbi:MAG: DUF3185 domain-containing protein [Planctomycetia bacterium]
MKLLGIVLIVFGVLALVYHGFTITIPKDTIDLGVFSIRISDSQTIPLPPIVGCIALAVGVLLIYTTPR